jgi:L-ribulokinase
MPVNAEGIPLCLKPEWAGHPHAYLKLWKHHGGEPQAERMLKAARERNEPWLSLYGGGIQCELLLAKALETAEMDPAVWEACHRYVEMGDWLAWLLTGRACRSSSLANCNSYHRPSAGYPGADYWQAVSPGIEPVPSKLLGDLLPLGSVVGHLTPKVAGKLGLLPETPVAAPLIDSHASVLGCGADRAGDMVAVLGTSACYLLNDDSERGIPGIYSVAYEAHAPGLYGYEGGQSCFGDGLDWFIRQCVPAWLQTESDRSGEGIHALLSRKAAALSPGESGLIALDWLNGVRSPLMRPSLRGVLAGATLHTTAVDLYRAVVEACCLAPGASSTVFRRQACPSGVSSQQVGSPRKTPF